MRLLGASIFASKFEFTRVAAVPRQSTYPRPVVVRSEPELYEMCSANSIDVPALERSTNLGYAPCIAGIRLFWLLLGVFIGNTYIGGPFYLQNLSVVIMPKGDRECKCTHYKTLQCASKSLRLPHLVQHVQEHNLTTRPIDALSSWSTYLHSSCIHDDECLVIIM